MPLYVDQSELPLLQLKYVGAYTDEELYQFLREVDGVLGHPGKKLGLVDLVGADPGTARQRRLHAEWISERKGLLARSFAAAAIVTDNALIRGTVTAVFWIAPLPLPTHVAASVARAQEWLAPYMAQLRGTP